MRLTSFIALLSLLGISSCKGPSLDEVSWPCETNNECERGQICQARSCVLSTEANGISSDQILFGQSATYQGDGPIDLGQGMKIGVESYFAHINAEGGVHGRKLILETHEDNYVPEEALENMKKMFSPRRVFAALGNMGSPTSLLTAPWAEDHGIPFLLPYTGAPNLRESPPNKWIYHFRASYREEAHALAHYLLDGYTIAQSGQNLAVFAQGPDDQGNLDRFGLSGFEGVVDLLRGAPYSIPESEIELWSYQVGERAEVMDEPIQRLLKWLASDAIQADSSGKRNAFVLMVATSAPATAFVTSARQAFARVQRTGAESGDPGNWSLTPEEVAAIQDIDEVIFSGISPATRTFIQGLAARGKFTDSDGSETPFCEGMIITHIVPHFDAQVQLVNEYRAHLDQYNGGTEPGFASLEGYIAARITKEALEVVGPNVSTESFLQALEGLGEFDIGLGVKLNYSIDEHQASHNVWASSVSGESCEISPISMEDFE